jgi:LDH2 family malate/lactate/ureidoglycolate dehydrogenase
MNLLPAELLARFVAAVLEAIGMRPVDAEYAAAVMVEADLAGHESHGVRQLPFWVERADQGLLAAGERPVIELDLGALCGWMGGAASGTSPCGS